MPRPARLARPALALALALGCGLVVFAAPTKEEDAVVKYAKQMKTAATPKLKIEAIKEIAKLGSTSSALTKSVAPDLLKLLDDADAKVRAEAAHALGQIDPDDKKAAVERLTKLLKDDKDEDVRKGAARGLAAMGNDSKAAAPALREAMEAADKKDKRFYRDILASVGGK